MCFQFVSMKTCIPLAQQSQPLRSCEVLGRTARKLRWVRPNFDSALPLTAKPWTFVTCVHVLPVCLDENLHPASTTIPTSTQLRTSKPHSSQTAMRESQFDSALPLTAKPWTFV